jgi:hypothetical protein
VATNLRKPPLVGTIALPPALAVALESAGVRAGPDGYDLGGVEATLAARAALDRRELGDSAASGPGVRSRFQAQVWAPHPTMAWDSGHAAYRRARTRVRTAAEALARALAHWLTRYG